MVYEMISSLSNQIHLLIISILIFIMSYISTAIAIPAKYICLGETNNLGIIFDTKLKKVVVGNNKPKKYWGESIYRFWHSAKGYNVYEYTFKYSYNKLSGELKVKSHHMVTSENKWFDYKCSITK